MGPQGYVGRFTQAIGWGCRPLPFSGSWSAQYSIRCRSSCNRCRKRSKRSAEDPLKRRPHCAPVHGIVFHRRTATGPPRIRHGDDPRFRPHGGRVRRRPDDRRKHTRANAGDVGADLRSCRSPRICAGALAGRRPGDLICNSRSANDCGRKSRQCRCCIDGCPSAPEAYATVIIACSLSDILYVAGDLISDIPLSSIKTGQFMGFTRISSACQSTQNVIRQRMSLKSLDLLPAVNGVAHDGPSAF
jgi:hypothetical protein